MRRAAAVPLLVLALVAASCGGDSDEGARETETEEEAPAPPPPQPAPEPPATSPPPPPVVEMTWQSAGAFVWHEADIAPELLAEELRTSGFGWVAVFLADGLAEDPIEDEWVDRFRRASGLPVGGWGVLRAQPVEEAALAAALVERHGLDFFIANAEAEYVYSGPAGPDPERFERSQRFVTAFRSVLPRLPAALSSYCRPDQQDLDWKAWSEAGFSFLPQAYVNDFGSAAAPDVCVRASSGHFAPADVHPTIGMYPGVRRSLGAPAYGRLLKRAGTIGFSVYLAETRMTAEEWRGLGEAITQLGIARPA